ncbi:perlucin-like [Pomacea canaliculata]|uniref:perlucin-like n=1 Tax=Pomacea canaliculata TaxID=400727 RepID=UPI000D726FB6|nr:perlucin-like [Pomacea canaliculata]
MKTVLAIFISLLSAATAQCPSGYIHHDQSCYVIPMAEGSWADGMTLCRQLGGQLAVIDTAAEQTFVEGLLKRYGAGYPNDADFWVGGGDFLVDGDWRWIMKNQAIDPHVSYWAPGEPDNGGGPQGCLRISAALNYKWESGDCDSVEYAVCEQPVRSEVGVGK